jgi:hypothetical protein
MARVSQPDKIIAIDWSGRVDVAGQRRHIVAAIITRDGVTIESGRTREEWITWLIQEAKATPRMVVSLDCCFSYPAWFLAEHGCKTVFDFWKHVASGEGEKWLAQECNPRAGLSRDERFWGKPHKKPAQFCGAGMPRMMRLTDMENKIVEGMSEARAAKVRGIAPKSPFQIGGSGSTGTGSLRAIPFLLQLHEAGFRIWPFESAALDNKRPQPLLVEMYARLLTGAVKKSSAEARRTYLHTKMREDAFYAKLKRGVVVKAVASEDAFDALISAMEMARHAREFATLKKTKDAVRKLEGITWIPAVERLR